MADAPKRKAGRPLTVPETRSVRMPAGTVARIEALLRPGLTVADVLRVGVMLYLDTLEHRAAAERARPMVDAAE